MSWDIAYHIGEVGGIHCAQTRTEALAYCCDLLARGAEIDSVVADSKKDQDELSLGAIKRYAQAKTYQP